MIISKIKIIEGIFTKTFQFTNHVNMIYSKENSVGKTTLIRFILFGLGYQIPSTKKISFNNHVIETTITNNGNIFKLIRNKNTIELKEENETKNFYTLPFEINDLHKVIFNTSNDMLLDNLLGVFYIDQDKGWTLLNRGSVIGRIKFNIEELIRALANRDTRALEEKLTRTESELKKYKKMFSLADYQKEIKQEKKEVVYETLDEELEQKISILMFDKNQKNNELSDLNQVINNNKKFINYVDQMKLTVSYKDNVNIPVNRDTISNYRDIEEYTQSRKRFLLGEIRKIDSNLNELKKLRKNENKLIETESIIDYFDDKVLNIDIDMQSVENIIKLLDNERKDIREEIKILTMSNNQIINDIYNDAKKYADKLSISDYFDVNNDYIFTTDLKSLSGAVLHLMVFSFRLAYINAVRNYSNISLPIIIDSPNGREVKRKHIEDMYNIINNEFSNHQIIIASIYTFNYKCNIIEIKNSLLEQI